MWVWIGLELLGCLPIEKQVVRNGVLYKIESITEDSVNLEGGISLSKEECVQLMRLSHAMTYASVQGRETEGSLCLYDTTSAYSTFKHLYVALSRAKRAENVRVQSRCKSQYKKARELRRSTWRQRTIEQLVLAQQASRITPHMETKRAKRVSSKIQNKRRLDIRRR